MTKVHKGFTLIELVVVVAIVGLLATAATITYSKSQAKARDTRRAEDLAVIKDALKMYYQQHYSYPHENDSCSITINGITGSFDSSNCNGIGDWKVNATQNLAIYDNLVSNGFIKSMPKDPINDFDYEYFYEPFGPTLADGSTIDDCSATDTECVNVLVGARMELPNNGGSGLCFSDKENLDPVGQNLWQNWCDNL